MRKYLGDQLWSLATLKNADNHNLIISDLRFKVEAQLVKECRGTLIYIDRPGCEPGNHQSEKEAVELYKSGAADFVIHNDGTLKDLFYKCKDFISFEEINSKINQISFLNKSEYRNLMNGKFN